MVRVDLILHMTIALLCILAFALPLTYGSWMPWRERLSGLELILGTALGLRIALSLAVAWCSVRQLRGLDWSATGRGLRYGSLAASGILALVALVSWDESRSWLLGLALSWFPFTPRWIRQGPVQGTGPK
ncbi:hypothetical protein GCM10027589_25320 [Actinocorallia lasiicapitis]